jgi:23S rRNA (cytosine1962-C5)-methyltransferase
VTEFLDAIATALGRRARLFADLGTDTDCMRLFHGVNEGIPGLAIDRYGPILLLQTWRNPLEPGVPEAVANLVLQHTGWELLPVWNHRATAPEGYRVWHDPPFPPDPVGLEYGVRFDVRPRHRGQDPLLFLDFRVGRREIRRRAAGQTVLNTFSYTCGAGLSALAAGAREVLNVDVSASALEVGAHNAALNAMEGHRAVAFDALVFLRHQAGLSLQDRRGGRRPPRIPFARREWDLVVLDPPRWAKGPWGAIDVVRDYPSLFKPAILATRPGGAVLATHHVPGIELQSWIQQLRRCAEKAGRPLLDVEILTPDADFPSPDGQHPLKMAWCTVSPPPG